MKKTDILDVISRKLAPFIIVFGFYLITYGHLSPGGGFQGGVALASGAVLLLLCQGKTVLHKFFPVKRINYTEAFGYLAFIVIGAAGLLIGKGFLSGFSYFGGKEIPGAVIIFILNLIIGLKVGAGITLICYYLFIEREDEE